VREVVATSRTPRVEIVRDGSRYISRVKVTRTAWMESDCTGLEDALARAKSYIRDVTFGRVDPDRALKMLQVQG
jgi:hypothetical protein